jgi:uncharacterized membrane protein YccC
MAMITITVLSTPNLGNSFTKAAQRIAGVMIGKRCAHLASSWNPSLLAVQAAAPPALPVCASHTS